MIVTSRAFSASRAQSAFRISSCSRTSTLCAVSYTHLVRNTESEVSEDPFPLSSSHSSLLRLSTVFQVLPSPPGLYYDIPDHSLLCPLSSLQMRGSDDPQLLLLLYNPFNHSFLYQSGYSQSASPPATTVYESASARSAVCIRRSGWITACLLYTSNDFRCLAFFAR